MLPGPVEIRHATDLHPRTENATIRELIDHEEFCGPKPANEETPKLDEITATELKTLIDNNEDIQIIDVREQFEYDIARIPNAKLIPLGDIIKRMSEIDPEKTTVVQCKGGVRSARAIDFLKAAGFEGRLINLRGGIGAWSNEVDPSVPRY